MPLSAERNIYVYTPGEIVPTTKKRRLEGVDLDFGGASTQHATHALHPYVAAINPPLARRLIDTYVSDQGSVLDPFCGGGGVLVESILSGRRCAGFDINPLASLITKAKTTWIERSRIEAEYSRILAMGKELVGKVRPKVSRFARYWFKTETLPELAALSYAVSKCQEEDIKNLFLVILSATVRSVMLTYRGEVRLRKLQDDDLQKFNPNTFEAFYNHYTIALEQVPNLPKGYVATVGLENARNLPVDDAEYNSIICSPPYADDTNGVGYFQFSRYMLEWLNMSRSNINTYKREFLGEIKADKSIPPSMTLHTAASRVAERSQKHYKEAVAFYADYYEALVEMRRVVRDWIIIAIGNRVLARTLFDNANITLELFQTIDGVEFADYYSRTIRKKRIPNLGADGGGINIEHILIFKKV